MDKISFSSSFSNIIDSIGRRLIGLYEKGEFDGMLGFRMRMIIEYFHEIGK